MNGPMLCFGDSNTYGYDPRSYLGSRYPTEERWTGILKAGVGNFKLRREWAGNSAQGI